MKMSALWEYLIIVIEEMIPVCLVGDPGIGKTTIIRDVCEYLDRRLLEIHPIEWESIDFRGFPVVDSGVPRFVPYGEMKDILTQKVEKIVVLIDDAGHAKDDVLKSVMQIMRRRLGENVIPDNVYLCMATNDTTDAAGVRGFPEPLKSSVVLLNVEHEAKASLKYAGEHGWESELCFFLEAEPSWWHMPQPTKKLVNTPSPRQWSRVNDNLRSFKARIDDGRVTKETLNQIEFSAYKGCVGEDAAKLFVSLVDKMRHLKRPIEYLEDAVTIMLPLDPSEYAVLFMLCNTVSRVFERTEFQTDMYRHQMWKLVGRVPTIFQRLMIRVMCDADPTFTTMVQHQPYRERDSRNVTMV